MPAADLMRSAQKACDARRLLVVRGMPADLLEDSGRFGKSRTVVADRTTKSRHASSSSPPGHALGLASVSLGIAQE